MDIDYIDGNQEPKNDILSGCPAGEIKGLVFWPDERLKQPSEIMSEIEIKEELSKLVADMATTMYMTGGMGLSAIQIGVPKQVFIVDLYAQVPGKSQLLVAVNPALGVKDGVKKWKHPESCLSIPNVSAPVERYQQIRLTARDRLGQRYSFEVDGHLGRVIQHEYDHLGGTTFIDRLGPLNKKAALKSAMKFHRGVKNDTIRVKRKRKGTSQRGRR